MKRSMVVSGSTSRPMPPPRQRPPDSAPHTAAPRLCANAAWTMCETTSGQLPALHCTAVRYTMPHCATLSHSALLCATQRYSALRCATLRHSALLCASLRYSAPPRCAATLRHAALRCTALSCSALLCTALHCEALSCPALPCAALRCAALPAGTDGRPHAGCARAAERGHHRGHARKVGRHQPPLAGASPRFMLIRAFVRVLRRLLCAARRCPRAAHAGQPLTPNPTGARVSGGAGACRRGRT